MAKKYQDLLQTYCNNVFIPPISKHGTGFVNAAKNT